MQTSLPTHADPVSRFRKLKAHEKTCCDRLESLNRMLHRLSPSDHLYGAVIRGLAKWSREQIATDDALWETLSEMNSAAAQTRPEGPTLVLVK